jgi:hypothetical protein
MRTTTHPKNRPHRRLRCDRSRIGCARNGPSCVRGLARVTQDFDILVKITVRGVFITASKSGALVSEGAPASEAAPLSAIRAEVKTLRGVLLGAFDLRFRGDPEGRRIVQEIRARASAPVEFV